MYCVFGDQSSDYHTTIEELHRLSQNNSLLAAFLAASLDAVKEASRSLNDIERRKLLCRDLLDLSQQQLDNAIKDPLAYTVLVCVAQLGWSIV